MKYYIDTLPDCTDKKHPWKFDKNSVVLAKIPYTQEYHYHATNIAAYSLKHPKDNANLTWLLYNQDDTGAYHHNFTLPFYPMEKGWVGGLAQGLSASALIRRGYICEGKKAIDAMLKYCYDFGVIYEYPNVEILNGWIYALFGVMDLAKEDKEYESVVRTIMETIKQRVKEYDINGWTAYDSTGIPATPFYHNVHLKQFKVLNIDWPQSARYPKFKRMLYIMKKNNIRIPLRYLERRKWLKS